MKKIEQEDKKKMEKIVRYVFRLLAICLTCYMAVEYGGYWIFFLLFAMLSF